MRDKGKRREENDGGPSHPPFSVGTRRHAKAPMKNKRLSMRLTGIIVAFFVCFLAILLFFQAFMNRYQASVRMESGDHLIEISDLISSYIRGSIVNNRMVAEDIAYRLEDDTLSYGDEDCLVYLSHKIEQWSIDGIRLYTSDGRGYNEKGEPIDRDTAAEYIVKAKEKKKFWQVWETRVLFTVAIENGAAYNGSPVVAVSTEYDIGRFIENAEVNTFNDRADVYLVEQDGVIVTQYGKGYADTPYSLGTVLSGSMLESLDGKAVSQAQLLNGADEAVYIFTNEAGSNYLAIAPVRVEGNQWQVVYTIPTEVINASMLEFSGYVMLTSIVVLLLFFALFAITFLSIYRLQKELMDRELSTRERLFDLLTRNGHEVYSLYSLHQSEPVYQSENCKTVLGEDGVLLYGTVGHVTLKDRAGRQSPFLKALGDSYSKWDGRGDYITDNILLERNGEQRLINAHIYAVPDEPELYMSVTRDVTREAEHAEALRSALALANSANKAKTAFLSRMSHDIRTPMNAIINMTAFARQSAGDPDKQAEYFDIVQSSSEHLLSLINDVLEVSRIESGKTVVTKAPFSLQSCIAEVSAMIRPLADKKKHRFAVEASISHPGVLGDKLKLNQILLNLLNNAVKYTPDGGEICFTAEELPAISEKQRAYRFVVRDSGIGIAQEELANIFEPFSRIHDDKTQEIEGTGLGLSITQGFVNAMGGRISVTSEKGRGSEFVVELSFDIDSAMEAPEKAEKRYRTDFRGKRALFCEDNEINRTIAEKILRRYGLELECAPDGAAGLERFLESQPGYYDIVFMDVQMPRMDGYETTRRIRSSGRPDAAAIPIVAMTANAFAEDVEKARVAGMNGHVAKPIDIEYLISVISPLLGEQQTEA